MGCDRQGGHTRSGSHGNEERRLHNRHGGHRGTGPRAANLNPRVTMIARYGLPLTGGRRFGR